MTSSQLILLFAVVVLWALLALDLLPMALRGRARRAVMIIGGALLGAMLLISLLTSNPLVWLRYAAVAFIIFLALYAYSRIAQRYTREEEPELGEAP